jgi:TrmH family RNA methyltransferase
MAKLQIITSPANPLLKDVRKAIVRGTLTEEGLMVVETFHLLEEALRSDCDVRVVLTAESAQAEVERHLRGLSDVRLVVIADADFQRLAGTESSQGLIALVQPPSWDLEQLFRGSTLVVVLDGVQDPGNAGAIARSAEAFGATGILFLKGSVSPYNPKTLRASAGALFSLPFVHGLDTAAGCEALKQQNVDIYAAVAHGSGKIITLGEVDLTRGCALVIGSEGQGVSHAFRSGAVALSIPTVKVESLNAAVAAGILLYEARRQRSLKS